MAEPIAPGFCLRAQTVRIECDLISKQTGELAYGGLYADVRRNLTIGERRDLRDAATAIDQKADELAAHAKARSTEIDVELEAIPESDAAARVAAIQAKTAFLKEYAAALDGIIISRFGLVAPHIHDWNLYTYGPDGEMVKVPPPSQAGLAVLDEIETDLVYWLVNSTLMAYRAGFAIGSPTSGASLEPTPAPSAAKTTGKGLPSQRSRRKSSSPVA